MRPVDRLTTAFNNQLRLELPPLRVAGADAQDPEAPEFPPAQSEPQYALHNTTFGNYATVPSYHQIPYGPPPTPEPFVKAEPTQAEPLEWDTKPPITMPYSSGYQAPYSTVPPHHAVQWSSTFGAQNMAWHQFMTNANFAPYPGPQQTAWDCGPMRSRSYAARRHRRSYGPLTVEDRRRRNRETAARCRERKLAHVAALEAQLMEEHEKNQKLEEQLTLLNMENEVLRMYCENNRTK